MKSLDNLRTLLAKAKIELTAHALHRIVERNISKQEIIEAGESANEIEDYPNDKYFPSCLLLGFTDNARPLHLHLSRVDNESVRLITLYEPNENEWTGGYTKRR